MSDLYGKTTESLESLNNASCATRMTCGGRASGKKKAPKKDIELGAIEQGPAADEEQVHVEEVTELMSSSQPKEDIKPPSRFQNVARGVVYAKRVLSDPSEDPAKRALRAQQKIQHLNKFSRVRQTDQTEVEFSRASASAEDKPVPERKRDNAAAVLFRAAANKVSAKPNLKVSSLDTYGGRSFLESDLNNVEPEDIDYSFFKFSNDVDIRDEEIDAEEEEFATAGAFTEGFKRAYTEKKKEILEKKRKKRVRFWLGTLLGGKKKAVVNKLKSRSDEYRTFFTVWLSFVQLVIMIVVLAIYPFAPIGKDVDVRKKEVVLSREGVLIPETLQRKVVESFWLGPSLEHLILLGAKYAPCMRRDRLVYKKIEEERRMEKKTGCCMQERLDGCIQRGADQCTSSNVEFKANAVCGQDPGYCAKSSKLPSKWGPSIITWPKCDKIKETSTMPRHMTCAVTGRPCCINTQGQCVITTQENCKFWDGIYHPDANLCSQVDCLAATCGNTFTTDDYPDQFHRLLISLFLNAGILHLVIVLIFNFTLLRYVELYAGWLRTGLIFFLTGIGGNLWSSILIPYQAEVGESGAMFGIFACVFVEGIQMWTLIVKPWQYMGKLIAILFVMLLFGLLPYVDNYAHIFGFLYGIFCGFIILPHVTTKVDEEEAQKERMRYLILRIVSFFIVLVLTILGFVLFYYSQDMQSEAIALFNCPLGEKFCRNFNQGYQLEERDIEY